MIEITKKSCFICKLEKPTSDFHKHKTRGFQTYCKKCSTIKSVSWAKRNNDKVVVSRKKYQDANRHFLYSKYNPKRWEYRMRNVYGISKNDFDVMMISQNGSCAICLKHFKSDKAGVHVDHDHNTGKVRGLLCPRCNWAIVLLDSDSGDRAIQYVNGNRNKPDTMIHVGNNQFVTP